MVDANWITVEQESNGVTHSIYSTLAMTDKVNKSVEIPDRSEVRWHKHLIIVICPLIVCGRKVTAQQNT